MKEDDAWKNYFFLLQQLRENTEKFLKSVENRDRSMIHELNAEAKEISRKLNQVDKLLDQFEEPA